MRFAKLVDGASALNAVVQRESRGYSVYSNDYFYQDDCANLAEVEESLGEIKARLDKVKTIVYNGQARRVEVLDIVSVPASGLPYMRVYDLDKQDFRTFTLAKIGG